MTRKRERWTWFPAVLTLHVSARAPEPTPCGNCGKPVPGGWSWCADCEREYAKSMERKL